MNTERAFVHCRFNISMFIDHFLLLKLLVQLIDATVWVAGRVFAL